MSLAWLEQHHCIATHFAEYAESIKQCSGVSGDFNLDDLWQIISLCTASVSPSVRQAG